MEHYTPAELLTEAASAFEAAYCPYSKYHVGAALLTSTGRIFHGCNIENCSFSLTVCAERTAVFSAIAAHENKFKSMAIVATGESLPYPCGGCRQVMAEFCEPGFKIYVASVHWLDAYEELRFEDLMPKTFKLS